MIEPRIYGQWQSSNASSDARLIYMAFVIQQFVPIDLIGSRAYRTCHVEVAVENDASSKANSVGKITSSRKRGGIIPVYVRM